MDISKLHSYLRSVTLLKERVPAFSEYPFNLPAVSALDELEFHPKVTYIVGENGMGKSTVLEAIAAALGFNPEGGTRNFNFATRESHSELYQYLRTVRGVRKPKDGFFFRAESYYNVATEVDALQAFGSYGGKSLHDQSHGESFFATFMNRFSGHGLYIMDEPEAALSPFRQMALLRRIHDLVHEHSQFIIATHSPIIMAYPDACIYKLTPEGIETCQLEETDHYMITKEFINNREAMLRELLSDDD
ncbi:MULTISPECIES: AAA family ATPase [Paenibacillus]|uniref:AAA family ATPase n=1 Tax=Paenibacillus campinasensis TaxID=66347 RepID=A0A268EQZ2_9BACL|nr:MULTISPECIES: AAA family ATPase [Paenibacillus]MUG65406.1 AAA family ATPase [Paenibacillus campinasensis]PAD75555.1 AAA family ATPase [Paenibacillus campinasensis]PAK49496.1 AAA family ATPase [Paenibacillus sp. 7541]